MINNLSKNDSYYHKYLKYKKKYMKTKNNLLGGLYVTTLNNKCSTDSVDVEELCSDKKYPCLKIEGKCFSLDGLTTDNKESISDFSINIFLFPLSKITKSNSSYSSKSDRIIFPSVTS